MIAGKLRRVTVRAVPVAAEMLKPIAAKGAKFVVVS